jgi:hypothetical protein
LARAAFAHLIRDVSLSLHLILSALLRGEYGSRNIIVTSSDVCILSAVVSAVFRDPGRLLRSLLPQTPFWIQLRQSQQINFPKQMHDGWIKTQEGLLQLASPLLPQLLSLST